MVSHDLSRSIVTNQITFDQQDFHSTPEFERACQALVSKLETLDTITLPNWYQLARQNLASFNVRRAIRIESQSPFDQSGAAI